MAYFGGINGGNTGEASLSGTAWDTKSIQSRVGSSITDGSTAGRQVKSPVLCGVDGS